MSCLHPVLHSVFTKTQEEGALQSNVDLMLQCQQLRVVMSSSVHSRSFAHVVLMHCGLDSDLRPAADRPWLIRLSSYSGASQILLSTAVIYDTISWGGLDRQQPLPPACQGCGTKCCRYRQASHWKCAPSLPAYFHITSCLRKYWTRELGPPPGAVLH